MPISEMNAPLRVSTDGTADPYVVVTPEQLGAVVVAFREEGIDFRVEDDAVLSGGTPALAIIDLGGGPNVERVQHVLDRVESEIQAKQKRRRRSPTRQELVVRGSARAMHELMRRLDRGNERGIDNGTVESKQATGQGRDLAPGINREAIGFWTRRPANLESPKKCEKHFARFR
jgi:hypothetical protein